MTPPTTRPTLVFPPFPRLSLQLLVDPAPAPAAFPATRHSVVRATRSRDPAERARAFDALVGAYWKPVYTYLRLRWRLEPADAEDLVQGFFTRAVLDGLLDGYDPARGRFRTFLRVCVDRHAANERQAARRLKRGGGAQHLSLDFAAAEGALPARALAAAADDPEALFHREAVRALFEQALAAFRAQAVAVGKAVHLRLFERCDLDAPDGDRAPSYAALAAEHGLPVTQVTNHLAWARREFRRQVLATLRAASASDEEFRADARELLGVDVV